MDSMLALCLLALTFIHCGSAQSLIENCTEFHQRPMDTIIAPGGSACLDCAYFSRAPRWQVNLDMSFSAIESEREPEECDCMIEGGRLCFNSVDAEAASFPYRCLVQFPGASPDLLSCSFQIQLATPPVINEAIMDLTVNEESTLSIPVNFNPGIPVGVVSWLKGGVPVSGDRVSIDAVTGTLTITDVAHTDRGQYTVEITNSAGTDTRDVNVFVNFAIIEQLQYETDNGMSIVCVGVGYPSEVTVTLTGSSGLTRVGRAFEDEVSVTTTISSMSDCLSEYTCSIMAGSRTMARSITPGCNRLPLITNISSVSYTAVIVTWDPAGADEVRYRRDGGSEVIDPVDSTTTTLEIGNLSPGIQYTFQLYTSTQDPMLSPNRTHTIAPCPGTFSDPITGVSASIQSISNSRTTRLTWMESGESGVTGYRVFIAPCVGSVCSIYVDGKQTTSYTFPASICNNQAYSFHVQSVNSCGGGGPNSSFVVRTCDIVTNRITEINPDVEAVTIKWDFDEHTIPLIISAKMVALNSANQQVIQNYSVTAIQLESACIMELEGSTTYEICLYPTFVNDPSRRDVYCQFVTTLSGQQDEDRLMDCLMVVSTSTDEVINTGSPSPPPGTIENWHIAIIVVGGLAIVAMVFCLVGLCFACQTSSKKVDFGSTSSLQTNSIRDGVTPMSIHSHQRSMSPSRSCLSYHTKGHSTNWSDHVDTLRQMETDTGTHV